MPQPKPFKETYQIVKNTREDLKTTIKPPMLYAVKGNKRFIEELTKINWESLSSKDVLVMVLMMLSYGLVTNKEAFDSYIKKENLKQNVSLFKYMLDGDGLHIRNCLNTGSFTGIFRMLFATNDNSGKTKQNEDVLKKLDRRIVKIKDKDFTNDERAEIESLINTIIQGREIQPEATPE